MTEVHETVRTLRPKEMQKVSGEQKLSAQKGKTIALAITVSTSAVLNSTRNCSNSSYVSSTHILTVVGIIMLILVSLPNRLMLYDVCPAGVTLFSSALSDIIISLHLSIRLPPPSCRSTTRRDHFLLYGILSVVSF